MSTGIIVVLIFSILFVIVYYVVSCIVCDKIAYSKNLNRNHRWLGLLGVLGIIIMLFVKPVFVKCSNCGLEYHSYYSSCPYCQHNMMKTSNAINVYNDVKK